MANTVTTLTYANTFGDWVTTTNQVATEINALGKGNYVKDTGLLTINSPGIGLQVSNNSLFTGNVVISGAGQALQVSHDAIFGGNVTILGSTSISLNEIDLGDITGNTMHANVATFGTLAVTGNETVGGNLTVTGNTTIGGNLTVTGNTNISLNEIVVGDITSNTSHANVATIGTASLNKANVTTDLGVTGNTYIIGNLTVTGNTNLTIDNISMDEIVTGNLTVNGDLAGTGTANLAASLLASALAYSVALG